MESIQQDRYENVVRVDAVTRSVVAVKKKLCDSLRFFVNSAWFLRKGCFTLVTRSRDLIGPYP